jgi:hypothetical protein
MLVTILKIFFYWFALGCTIALLMFSCLMFAKVCETTVNWLSGLRQRFAKPSKV